MAKKPTYRTTIDCSFCGKSQHDVKKIIAGPTVFICDECIALCDLIVASEMVTKIDGKNAFFMTIDEGEISKLDLKLLPAMFEAIERELKGVKINITGIRKTYSGNVIHLTVVAPDDADKETLVGRIQELTSKLRIEQQKYLEEKGHREKLEQQLNQLKIDMFDNLMASVLEEERKKQVEVINVLTIFFDVVGFSKMSPNEREKMLNFLRSICGFVFGDSEVHVNMWGDGIIAVCKDINSGLRCGCDFISHLNVHGYDVRAGAAWGLVRFAYNAGTGRRDVDGDSINLGARLEPLADAGEMLVAEDVYHNPDLKKSDFFFQRKTKSLVKATGAMVGGEQITVYGVRIRNNLSLVS